MFRPGHGMGQVVTTPAVVILPITPAAMPPVVNHRAPSGPGRNWLTLFHWLPPTVKTVIALCTGMGATGVGVLDGTDAGVGDPDGAATVGTGNDELEKSGVAAEPVVTAAALAAGVVVALAPHAVTTASNAPASRGIGDFVSQVNR